MPAGHGRRHPTTPRTQPARRQSAGFVIVLGLAVALVAVGSDFVPLSLRPLDYLGLPYPRVFRVIHLLGPALAVAVWLASRRSAVATGAAFFIAVFVMTQVARWADGQPARIPVTRFIDGTDLSAMEGRLGFRVWETGDKDGTFLLVGRTNERAATDETKRHGVYRPQ